MHIRGICASAILIGVTASAVSAETFRWIDDNGNPVLSDRPPPSGTPYTEVVSGGGFGPSRSSSDAPSSGPESSSSAFMAPTADGQAVAQDAATYKQPELCEQAKDTIFKLETFPRARVKDETGEVRFMTDSERSQQLQTAKLVRDAHCE